MNLVNIIIYLSKINLQKLHQNCKALLRCHSKFRRRRNKQFVRKSEKISGYEVDRYNIYKFGTNTEGDQASAERPMLHTKPAMLSGLRCPQPTREGYHGELERDELGPVLEALGRNVTDSELDTMLVLADVDGSGAVSWTNLLQAMADGKPANGGLCVQLYWSYAFYFYDLRKHYAARMTIDLGLNVLQTDTDVAWFADPYPALKNGALRTLQLVTQGDLPLANAGIVYAQGVRRGGGAGWVLHETQARVRLFSLYPHLVPHFVAWARPPYFSNADEQSLMNDVLASAISGQPCFIFSTAIRSLPKSLM